MAKNTLSLILICTAALYRVAFCQQKDLLPVDQLKDRFLVLKDEIWNSMHDNEVNKERGVEVDLIIKFQKFGDELAAIFPNDLNHRLDVLEGSYAWARAYGELRTIYALYETFRRFQAQQTTPGRIPSPKKAWFDLTETILHDSKSSMPATTKRLSDTMRNEGLFKNALKEIQIDMICNIKESPHQIVLNLYNTIVLTELKAYMMMQFAYMLNKQYNKGNNARDIELLEKQYKDYTKQLTDDAYGTLKSASRHYWMCDPKRFIKNQTYVEITELLQGYIQNEADLNPEGTCMENCAYYTYTKSHSCYKNLYCRNQRRCNGKILKCKFFDSDAWVCPATQESRRYQYVEYENGQVLGRKQECQAKTKVDSWWRWLFWHCSYCMCLCDEQGSNSDRFFSMRSAIANIRENRVVTGLRFIKENRVIHLQIQEGKLLPYSDIDLDTVKWVDVDTYKITDRNVYSGQDFHTLTWESRALDLDDLIANKSELLTGVRFKMLGAHLNFEIFVTPFDYATGKLQPEKSQWKDNFNTDASYSNPRKKIDLENMNIPIHTTQPSIPDSKNDQYLEFTHSSFESDVAQTTIPFIDVQKVEMSLPKPLSGAGVYHKGYGNFGGFIGLKTISFDYTHFVQNAAQK